MTAVARAAPPPPDPDPPLLDARACAGLSDDALAAHLLELHRLRAKVEGAVLAATGVFDGRRAWADDAARSAAGWLVPRADVRRPQAGAEVRLARQVVEMPHTTAAALEGRLGRAKLELLAQARTPEVVELFAAHEAALVEAIAPLRVADAAVVLRRWVERARVEIGWCDPETPDPPPAPPATLRLHSTFEGRWVLDGDLDTECGSILDAAVAAEVDALWRAKVFGPDDGLTPAQRRGLALVHLARRQGRADTVAGELRPSIEVIVDWQTLVGDIGHPNTDSGSRPGPGGGGPRDPGLGSRPGPDRPRVCETRDGVPLARETVLRLACNGRLHRLVLDAQGAPLDLGHDARLATPAQRRALRHTYRGCAFPGCDAPPGWCEAHHIAPFDPETDTGPTDLANLVPLCSFHHHRIHEGRYRLAKARDSTITVRRPDGTPLRPNRPRAPTLPP